MDSDSNDLPPPKPVTDPEQLMKLLELQTLTHRKERSGQDSRAAFRIWSLVIILVGAAIALWVLEMMLAQIAPPKRVVPAATVEAAAK